MKMLLATLISMSLFISCTPSGSTPVHDNFISERTMKDVSYGKDSAQKMDIFLPAGRNHKETKSIILIHGGGWNGGNKSDFAAYIDSFKKRMPDYAIFNLNYRLVNNGNLFPTQENDVKAAVDFIVTQSGDYGINTDKLVLLGASAGAHLALLQAYKYNSPRIAAVIDFFGPSDLEAMYREPWHPLVPMALQMITGTTLAANPNIYRNSSPVNFITEQTPPTLIFHGGKDMVVDVSQSKRLKQKLEAKKVQHELVVYSGQRHGWYGTTLTRSFDKMQEFLQNVVQ
jgi:acetyl esterase/lipase